MDSIARILLVAGLAAALPVAGCEEQGTSKGTTAGEHAHAEGDGHDHDGAGHMGDEHMGGDHDEAEQVALGAVTVGDMEVQAFQGHGQAAPGKELHLVVRLPGGDTGASTVRGWIGTDDRYGSVVAKADYSAQAGGYELHALAPDPMPENASWWIEVEMPDGKTHVGSVPVK